MILLRTYFSNQINHNNWNRKFHLNYIYLDINAQYHNNLKVTEINTFNENSICISNWSSSFGFLSWKTSRQLRSTGNHLAVLIFLIKFDCLGDEEWSSFVKFITAIRMLYCYMLWSIHKIKLLGFSVFFISNPDA